MPLVTCKDCSVQVSDKAHSCPHCGRPFLEDKLNQNWFPLSLIVIILLFAFVANDTEYYRNKDCKSSVEAPAGLEELQNEIEVRCESEKINAENEFRLYSFILGFLFFIIVVGKIAYNLGLESNKQTPENSTINSTSTTENLEPLEWADVNGQMWKHIDGELCWWNGSEWLKHE